VGLLNVVFLDCILTDFREFWVRLAVYPGFDKIMTVMHHYT
jgi:hypothetical protein